MIRIGTCSWAEKTILTSGFYPSTVKTAKDRLLYYAEHFDTVEVDSTYYAIPALKVSDNWANCVPENFLFHIKAYGGLTGHSIDIRTLPKDIREKFPQDQYRQNVENSGLLDLISQRFIDSLKPLQESNKLGVLVFQYPPWFRYSEENMKFILKSKSWCGDIKVGIEFRHGSWLEDGKFYKVTDFLHENGFVYITADEPQYNSLVTIPFKPFITNNIGYFRFHGRNKENWLKKGIETALRYSYSYSDSELNQFAIVMKDISSKTQLLFGLFNNCHGRKAVDDAKRFSRILTS